MRTAYRWVRKYILGSNCAVASVILPSKYPREDLKAMKTDTEIERDVKAELGWDPQIDETDIAVTVNEGVVSLRDSPTATLRISGRCDHQACGWRDRCCKRHRSQTAEQ